MVCDKCESKLEKQANPDVWKDGARNTTGGKDGGRKVGQNMLLSKKTNKKIYSDPFGSKCLDCSTKIEKNNSYCNKCAYKLGKCKMCGVQVLDTTMYKMSNV